MPEPTIDGAQREVPISLQDKVAQMLEEGAARASAATNSDDKPVAPTPREPEPAPAADDDVIEYETPQGRQSLRISEVTKDPEAKRNLIEQLRRAHEPPKPVVDEQALEAARRRGAIERDIARGFVRVNEFTGQLEETALGRQIREQSAEGRGGKPARAPVDADPLSELDQEERTKLETLRRKAIEEGDVEALAESDQILARAHSAHARRIADESVQRFRQDLVTRDAAAERRQTQVTNLHLVNQEMARHPEVFGKFDPQTGRFENESRAAIARNQVAAMLEITKSSKVDASHLEAVRVTAREFGGAPAPRAPGPGTQPTRAAPPPSVGRGSKVPPGPPPRAAGEGAQPKPTDPGRPKMGSPAMLDAVMKRLQNA